MPKNKPISAAATAIVVVIAVLSTKITIGQKLLKTSQHSIPISPVSPVSTLSSSQSSPQIISDEFSPLVTARCDRGLMYITITTQQPFYGLVHTRDFRKAPCMAFGDGSYNTTLKISLLAQPDDELFCGVQRLKGERSVSLAVRMHRSLELSEDRFFYLTCQSGYQNIKGGTYKVNLKLIDALTEQRVSRLIHGEPYKLRAELTPRDSITTLRMKNCFVFTKSNDNVQLIDRSGCPTITNLISKFRYNDSSSGEAYITEMFKFPNDAKVHFQCDALLCRENCDEPDCDGTFKTREYELDGYSQVSASTSAFIREPSDLDALTDINAKNVQDASGTGGECTEWRFPWLITLCICLAIMLLTMLLLNLFMCSSLTCRCIKSDIQEKEPAYLDDYDPYRADWTAPNSLHGSRYSLERARSGQQQQQQQQQQQYHSNETLNSNDTSNPDYHQHHVRSRRHAEQTTTDSEDDDNRYDQHFQDQSSLRPIRNREIDYYQPGYPSTQVKRF